MCSTFILLVYKFCPIFLQINLNKIKIYYVSKRKRKNVKSLIFCRAKYNYVVGLLSLLFLEESF